MMDDCEWGQRMPEEGFLSLLFFWVFGKGGGWLNLLTAMSASGPCVARLVKFGAFDIQTFGENKKQIIKGGKAYKNRK